MEGHTEAKSNFQVEHFLTVSGAFSSQETCVVVHGRVYGEMETFSCVSECLESHAV